MYHKDRGKELSVSAFLLSRGPLAASLIGSVRNLDFQPFRRLLLLLVMCDRCMIQAWCGS